MSNILNCLAAAPARMPLPGEAAYPDDDNKQASATSPRAAEGRRASRRRSVEVVAEAQGDVDAFMKELDQKRRQLDEQIHKFIAQKEREFKLAERDLRTRYRTVSPRPLQRPCESAEPAEPAGERPADEQSPGHERESELLGLFTPVFLPLLESKPTLDRSPSAPVLTDTASLSPERQALQRSNTDPAGQGEHPRLGLGPRTPSSGSDASKSLVSALKSPSSGPRLPKQKRVSLVVGDEVVAPSDNVHSELQDPPAEQDELPPASPDPSPPRTLTRTNAPPVQPPVQPPAAAVSVQPSALSLGFASAARDPNGTKEPMQDSQDSTQDTDLVVSPFTMDEELDGIQFPDEHMTQTEDTDTEDDSVPDSESTLRGVESPSPEANFPSPLNEGPGLEVPVAGFRSSSYSSAQPTSPGFSRPSVRKDPQLTFADQVYGEEAPSQPSLHDAFSRPSYSKQQQTSGSLGESFMQKNAQELMRRRRSSGRS